MRGACGSARPRRAKRNGRAPRLPWPLHAGGRADIRAAGPQPADQTHCRPEPPGPSRARPTRRACAPRVAALTSISRVSAAVPARYRESGDGLREPLRPTPISALGTSMRAFVKGGEARSDQPEVVRRRRRGAFSRAEVDRERSSEARDRRLRLLANQPGDARTRAYCDGARCTPTNCDRGLSAGRGEPSACWKKYPRLFVALAEQSYGTSGSPSGLV